MKALQYPLVILLALAAGFAGSALHKATSSSPVELNGAQARESTYERVMRTGVIRCGYIVWPPLLSKDPNTGAISGLAHDTTEALAAALNLRVEWAQEMSFATYLQDIETGKYDMECSGGWPNALRGKIDYYTKPYAYVPLVAVVRADDERFKAPEDFNKPDVKIAITDGETSSIVYKARFPVATAVSLPQNTSASDMILNVVTGKADFTLLDTVSVMAYQNANPGKVKSVAFSTPLHLIALSATIPPDDRYRQMLDVATDQLLNNGAIETIIKKYDPDQKIFLRVASPARSN
jgi:ABC-type amino acid transport substrate-binding protein